MSDSDKDKLDRLSSGVLKSTCQSGIQIVHTCLSIEEAMGYCFDRPSQNLIVRMDVFSGRMNVLLVD